MISRKLREERIDTETRLYEISRAKKKEIGKSQKYENGRKVIYYAVVSLQGLTRKIFDGAERNETKRRD